MHMTENTAGTAIAAASLMARGALVRTRTISPRGVHKAEVRETFRRDGRLWAAGPGWEFPQEDLEVIRGPIATPSHAN